MKLWAKYYFYRWLRLTLLHISGAILEFSAVFNELDRKLAPRYEQSFRDLQKHYGHGRL